MDNIKKELLKSKIVVVLVFILCFTGIVLLSYDYILLKVRQTFDTVNLELYGNEQPSIVDKKDTNKGQTNENSDSSKNDEIALSNEASYYFGYLEIPKINLKKGLVPLNSSENTVSKNVQTIYPSDYPDVDKGNLILAAHSGTSYISFFNELYKLNKGDNVYVWYNNYKYIYKITNIYTQPKNGRINIYRDYDKTTLTLITCTRNSKTTQTVYISELIRKEGV